MHHHSFVEKRSVLLLFSYIQTFVSENGLHKYNNIYVNWNQWQVRQVPLTRYILDGEENKAFEIWAGWHLKSGAPIYKVLPTHKNMQVSHKTALSCTVTKTSLTFDFNVQKMFLSKACMFEEIYNIPTCSLTTVLVAFSRKWISCTYGRQFVADSSATCGYSRTRSHKSANVVSVSRRYRLYSVVVVTIL